MPPSRTYSVPCLNNSIQSSFDILLSPRASHNALAAGLIPFNVLLRGAACTWNDIVDQRFDRRVARCRHRPVARGAVSTRQRTSRPLGLLTLKLWSLPASVRAVCGYLTWIVCGLCPDEARHLLPPTCSRGRIRVGLVFLHRSIGSRRTTRFMTGGSTLALFGANFLWTVTYDTIYAHKDIADDEQAGVKGMALRFRNPTKTLASVLTIAKLALLTFGGICADFSAIHFLGTVGGVAAAMAYYIWDVDLTNPESCEQWFHKQFFLVGSTFMGRVAGKYLKRLAV